jgi:Tfp pilus assembly pilus retraction ATPase PilT
VAAHEIMIGTSAIKNLIRENKIAQMYSAIQTGQSLGMQTLDQNLADLVRRNVISPAEARAKAKIPENFPGLAEAAGARHPAQALGRWNATRHRNSSTTCCG